MVLSHGVGVLWAATGGRGVVVSGRVEEVSRLLFPGAPELLLHFLDAG